MTIIWTVRWSGAQLATHIPYMAAITALFLAMATMHLVNTVHLFQVSIISHSSFSRTADCSDDSTLVDCLQNPAVCREEKRKARYLVVDAACCMVTILIMGGNTEVVQVRPLA